MGIITAVLATAGIFNLHLGDKGSLPAIPIYVVLGAHAAIAFGTLAGGWRIVHTMGSKITKLRPVGGFCAETAGALTLFGATAFGIPVSTTHTITGAIAGVGSTTRLSAVKWRVAGRIVWAWILTIPAAAIFAALSFLVIEFIHALVSRA
jgi:PiT family inorganic phosphate transporter